MKTKLKYVLIVYAIFLAISVVVVNREIYKVESCGNFEIFPSDPSGSLDESFFVETVYG